MGLAGPTHPAAEKSLRATEDRHRLGLEVRHQSRCSAAQAVTWLASFRGPLRDDISEGVGV